MVIKQQLKSNFIIPKKPKMGQDGSCKIAFSDNVRFSSIEEKIQDLQKLINQKRGRELQDETNQISKIKVDQNELLPVFTTVLKLSGSIKAEIIPGDPDNIDKKYYDWRIE